MVGRNGMPEAVLAITGASGARYGVRLLDALLEAEWKVSLIVTNAGAINLNLINWAGAHGGPTSARLRKRCGKRTCGAGCSRRSVVCLSLIHI